MFFVSIGRVRTAEKGEAKGEHRIEEEKRKKPKKPANGLSSREEFNVDRGEKNFPSFFFSALLPPSQTSPKIGGKSSRLLSLRLLVPYPVPSHFPVLSSPFFASLLGGEAVNSRSSPFFASLLGGEAVNSRTRELPN